MHTVNLNRRRRRAPRTPNMLAGPSPVRPRRRGQGGPTELGAPQATGGPTKPSATRTHQATGGQPVRRSVQPHGFSLLEIMVVLVLIGMVVSLITVNVMGRLEQGKLDTTRSQAYELAKSVDIYKLQTGNYPSTGQGLQVLVTPPKGKPIIDQLPKDPWNNDYTLIVPGQKNPTKFDIRSKGPDAQEGTEDDVGNWPAE